MLPAPKNVPWARDAEGNEIDDSQHFLHAWKTLGFVVDVTGDRTRFEEIDRG